MTQQHSETARNTLKFLLRNNDVKGQETVAHFACQLFLQQIIDGKLVVSKPSPQQELSLTEESS